jgi:hypothetical protein
MENNLLQKEIENFKKVGLTPFEKQTVFSRLSAQIGMTSGTQVRRSWMRVVAGHSVYTRIAVSLVILAVIGAGTAFAAEGSLPGDLLYPIKIYVNEGVRSALAQTPQEKANWAAEQVARREDEARSLVAQNRLSTTTRQTIEKQIRKATKDFRDSTDEIKSEGIETHDKGKDKDKKEDD